MPGTIGFGEQTGRAHETQPTAKLGPKSVFQDVTAISPGQDYAVAIDRALSESDAALVVIGPGWLTAATSQGTPACSKLTTMCAWN